MKIVSNVNIYFLLITKFQYTLVHVFPDQKITFGGTVAPTALCELTIIGEVDKETNERRCKVLTEALTDHMGIPADRYVREYYHCEKTTNKHDDVIKWIQFPRNWFFVRAIHRSSMNSPHKGRWRGKLMFFLICARINGWVNNREPGDLRRHRTHYDVTVMNCANALPEPILDYHRSG